MQACQLAGVLAVLLFTVKCPGKGLYPPAKPAGFFFIISVV
nr:MAG: hypothetical protein [Microvirus sp.]